MAVLSVEALARITVTPVVNRRKAKSLAGCQPAPLSPDPDGLLFIARWEVEKKKPARRRNALLRRTVSPPRYPCRRTQRRARGHRPRRGVSAFETHVVPTSLGPLAFVVPTSVGLLGRLRANRGLAPGASWLERVADSFAPVIARRALCGCEARSKAIPSVHPAIPPRPPSRHCEKPFLGAEAIPFFFVFPKDLACAPFQKQRKPSPVSAEVAKDGTGSAEGRVMPGRPRAFLT